MSTVTKSRSLKKENLDDLSSIPIVEETKIDLGKVEEVENRKVNNSQQEDNVVMAVNLQASIFEGTQGTPDIQEKVTLDEKNEQ